MSSNPTARQRPSTDERRPVRRALVSVYDKTGLDELAPGLARGRASRSCRPARPRRRSPTPASRSRRSRTSPASPSASTGGSRRCTRGCTPGILADLRLADHARQLAELGHRAVRARRRQPLPVRRDRALRRDPGRVRRADRHRRPVDGARRRQEPPERRGRRLARSATPRCSRRSRAGGFTLAQRARLAVEAFAHTAAYDIAVASLDGQRRWRRPADSAASRRGSARRGSAAAVLRYGENPHQRAALYVAEHAAPGLAAGRAAARQGDVLQQLRRRRRRPAGRVRLRRARASRSSSTPTRAASRSGPTSPTAHRKAHDCDPVSAFGGVIATNRPVTGAMAEHDRRRLHRGRRRARLRRRRARDPDRRKNVRLLRCDGRHPGRGVEWRPVSGGAAAADRPTSSTPPATTRRRWTLATGAPADDATLARPGVRLAGLPLGEVQRDPARRDGATVGVGMGQVNRVDSARLAVERAGEDRARGAVAASDAFFPFPDGLEVLIEAGVRAVVQPGGSVRDDEVVAAAEAAGRHDVPHRRPALLPLSARTTSCTWPSSTSRASSEPLESPAARRTSWPRSTRSTRSPTLRRASCGGCRASRATPPTSGRGVSDVIVNMSVWASVRGAAGLRLRPRARRGPAPAPGVVRRARPPAPGAVVGARPGTGPTWPRPATGSPRLERDGPGPEAFTLRAPFPVRG